MKLRPEPLSGKHKGSFAYYTIKDRLPGILTKVIDVLSRLASEHHLIKDEAKADDVKQVISRLSKLKNEMQTDKDIVTLKDDFADVDKWNAFVDTLPILVANKKTPSWFSVAWLSCECYLYRKIFEALQLSVYHKTYDPFLEQKTKALLSSEKPMKTLASYVSNFFKSGVNEASSTDQLRLEFEMMLEYSLWGNKCDLSVSSGRQESNQLQESSQLKALLEHIVSNHTEDIWTHIKSIKSNSGSRRIDFVLDNAGFELYSDLCFAEFLLDKQLCDVVVLHVKDIPWFVSDTTKKDFLWTIEQCFYSTDTNVKELGQRWQNRLAEKSFIIFEDPYWTLPYDYAVMESNSKELYSYLSNSDLIVFKGDLNYRKLIGDRSWPYTTRFSDALCGFQPAPLCSLRTLKADLVVGLQNGKSEKMCLKNKNWMVTGEYAVIQFSSKV